MCIDRIVLAFAGVMILVSAWLVLTGFVGLNLLQSRLYSSTATTT